MLAPLPPPSPVLLRMYRILHHRQGRPSYALRFGPVMKAEENASYHMPGLTYAVV